MARHARAIAAAELRVAQSRGDLRNGWRRVRSRLSQPPFLAAAAAAGVLVGFSLTRRGRTLASALIRLGVEYLIVRARPSRRISPS